MKSAIDARLGPQIYTASVRAVKECGELFCFHDLALREATATAAMDWFRRDARVAKGDGL